MKKLRKLGLVLLALLGILILTAGGFYYSMTPDYTGNKSLPKLNDAVEVYFDSYGIPHIYAENETDAFRTLCYVHAPWHAKQEIPI